MEEKIVLIDENDNIIGYEEKYITHQKGLLHRAFSVFIVNGDKMLIQQRNKNKYHSGGLWSNACCSHQREGEELIEAIHRRMKEELGIDCEIKELYHFIYRTTFDNGLSEYELDHVFLGEYAGEIYPDEQEIEQTKWIDMEELSQDMKKNPEGYSYWFKEALPEVLGAISDVDC